MNQAINLPISRRLMRATQTAAAVVISAQMAAVSAQPAQAATSPRIVQRAQFTAIGDSSIRLPASPSALPQTVDLREKFERAGLTPRNQGKRGTCSVFAVTAALEFAMAGNAQPAERLSVEFLNWASNQVVNHAIDGGFFSDLWQGYQVWGICRETDMPYAATFDPALQPTPAAKQQAKQRLDPNLQLHWIKRWNPHTGLTPAELASIKQTLASGRPVCAGLRWPKREKWQDGVLQMSPPDAVFDGHSVLLVGYQADPAQPGGGTFLFFNSNRPDQVCRMPWAYAEAYLNDAIWMESHQNP